MFMKLRNGEYLQNTHSKFPEFDQKLIKAEDYLEDLFIQIKKKLIYLLRIIKLQKYFIRKKGTIIIADTDGLHRGGYTKWNKINVYFCYSYYDPIKTRFTLNRNQKSKLSGIQKDFLVMTTSIIYIAGLYHWDQLC